MIVALLSLLDIIAGITVLFSVKFLAGYMAYVIFFKGLVSTASKLKEGKYFEWMGIIDVIAGLVLALMSFNIESLIFVIVGWLILLKGLYCFIRTIFNI
jgi:uncharacterized membrane protein HdeD (DUF308 family)